MTPVAYVPELCAVRGCGQEADLYIDDRPYCGIHADEVMERIS